MMHAKNSEVADESSQVPQPMTPNVKHQLPTTPYASSQSPTPGAKHNLAEHMMASLDLDDVQEKGVEVQEANPIVKESPTTRGPSASPAFHTVFIDNLPPFLNKTELEQLAAPSGNPLSCEVVPPSDKRLVNGGWRRRENCSCAFVRYATVDEAKRCIESLRSDGFHAEFARSHLSLSQPSYTLLNVEDVEAFMLDNTIQGKRPGQPPVYVQFSPEHPPNYPLPNIDVHRLSQWAVRDGMTIWARLDDGKTDCGGHAAMGQDPEASQPTIKSHPPSTGPKSVASALWAPRFISENISPEHPDEGHYLKMLSADGTTELDFLLPPKIYAAMKSESG